MMSKRKIKSRRTLRAVRGGASTATAAAAASSSTALMVTGQNVAIRAVPAAEFGMEAAHAHKAHKAHKSKSGSGSGSTSKAHGRKAA